MLKKVYLQQFEGMQSSKLWVSESGTICLKKGRWKGIFFVINGNKKDKGLDFVAEPPLKFS